MSETNMWDYLQPKLKAENLHCERITDRAQEGVPDVVYVNGLGTTGWLELKYLAAYPKDLAVTPLLTYGSHGLQTAQAFWLGRWARRGGRAGILLRVGSTDWWYWRSEGAPEWTSNIQTCWAASMATRRWCSGPETKLPRFESMSGVLALFQPFTAAGLVQSLCG